MLCVCRIGDCLHGDRRHRSRSVAIVRRHISRRLSYCVSSPLLWLRSYLGFGRKGRSTNGAFFVLGRGLLSILVVGLGEGTAGNPTAIIIIGAYLSLRQATSTSVVFCRFLFVCIYSWQPGNSTVLCLLSVLCLLPLRLFSGFFCWFVLPGYRYRIERNIIIVLGGN